MTRVPRPRPAAGSTGVSHPAFGDYGRYTWCGQCQRVQLTAKWLEQGWDCPNGDCEGRQEDAWRWEEVRGIDPSLPNHPILGRCYKLYAFDSEIEVQDDKDNAA